MPAREPTFDSQRERGRRLRVGEVWVGAIHEQLMDIHRLHVRHREMQGGLSCEGCQAVSCDFSRRGCLVARGGLPFESTALSDSGLPA